MKLLRKGDAVTCHYSGWLEDGTLFDSSRNRDSAFSFQLGEGVIEGWSRMVSHMKVGQKVLVHIILSLPMEPKVLARYPQTRLCILKLSCLISFKVILFY